MTEPQIDSQTESEPPIHPRVLALDIGKVRIGVALTDPLGYTAQPLLTLWRKSPGEDMRNLLRLLRRHAVTEVVVGNPLHMSGEVSPWALKVQAFAADLATRSGLPVHLFDERLTSVEAHALLDAGNHSRSTTAQQQTADRHHRKHLIDQVAAVLILDDWMQAQQHATARQALRANDTQ